MCVSNCRKPNSDIIVRISRLAEYPDLFRDIKVGCQGYFTIISKDWCDKGNKGPAKVYFTTRLTIYYNEKNKKIYFHDAPKGVKFCDMQTIWAQNDVEYNSFVLVKQQNKRSYPLHTFLNLFHPINVYPH